MDERLNRIGRCLTVLALTGLSTAIAAGASAGTQEASASEDQREFGREWTTLTSAQQGLIEDLIRRFNDTTGRNVDPEKAYDESPVSERTIFDAATHALGRSTLTAADGRSLGSPLDLIQHVEAINGRIRGEPGDRQFRIYVRLRPDAVEILNRSQEFSRKRDNTIFHKGYPLNYRQGGGVPSIQFSISRNGQRADIDVDYRASGFPAALFNGHLTAGNSDVRAGPNHARHNRRWDDLFDWWSDLFGLLFRSSDAEDEPLAREFPRTPRAGDSTVDVAVHDFLTSWLVEKKPALALAYHAPEAWACEELRREEGAEPLDYGMAPLVAWRNMQDLADAIGPVDSIEGLTQGVRFRDPDLKLVVRNEHHAQFVLYGVPRWRADAFNCSKRLELGEPPKRLGAAAPPERIEHFLSVFFLRTPTAPGYSPGVNGVTLTLLWKKVRGHWRIISSEVEPAATESEKDLPDVRPRLEVAEIERIEGPEGFVTASRHFLESWFVTKDYDAAHSYFSPRADACVNLFLEDGVAPMEGEALQRYGRQGLEQAGEFVGPIKSLDEMTRGVEPWDPRVKLIQHPQESAYSLYSVPDWMGELGACDRRSEEGEYSPPSGQVEATYGRHFASVLQFETRGGQGGAILGLGWTREDGAWRIVSFDVVTH